MKIELLRTRVARRMLMLFLFCAVVPIVVLAAITYPVEMKRVKVAVDRQLHDDGKGAGMLILARFERLAGMLQSGSGIQASLDSGTAFSAIATEVSPGYLTADRGIIGRLPALDARQLARLGNGKPVLVVSRTGGVPSVYLVERSIAGHGGYPRTWGLFNIGAAITGLELVRDGVELCAADAGGPLACNAAHDSLLNAGDKVSYRWPMFLMSEFGAPAWTITVSQSRATAFEPLAEFRRNFVLGLVFAIILVFVLSHVQIRRRMTPLADLEAGTRRLRDGDFSSRVTIESDDEFQSLGTAFNQMAGDLERQFTTLSALHSIDHAALQDHSAGAISLAALQRAPELLRADAVSVTTAELGDATGWRVDMVTASEPSTRMADAQLSRDELAALAFAPGPFMLAESEVWPSYSEALRELGCRHLMVFPIHGQRGPIGALIAGYRTSPALGGELLTTGGRLAEQLALGLSNVSLLEELDSLSLGALTALARTIDASSPWTAGHSERVTQYAVDIAESLGVEPSEVVRLRQGALLHDIGKIGVPPEVLDKAGPLTESELAIMQAHPVTGARIVESVRAFRDLVPLVLHHHELLDGSGYPHGLHGEQIPEIVRILTVADVYDALTSDRPYRAGLSADSALAILTGGINTKFDRRAVIALTDLIEATGTTEPEVMTSAVIAEHDERMFVGGGTA